MARSQLVVLLAGVLGLSTSAALACGCPEVYSDCWCHPVWSVEQAAADPCSNVPYLSPYNDRGVNLRLLLIDQGLASLQPRPMDNYNPWGWPDNPGMWVEYEYGRVPFHAHAFNEYFFHGKDINADTALKTASGYEGGEGTRWITLGNGLTAYQRALEAEQNIPQAERELLLAERRNLEQYLFTLHEQDQTTSTQFEGEYHRYLGTPAGTCFHTYVRAALSFYQGRYGEAKDQFDGLKACVQDWVRETAHYMAARTTLLLADASGYSPIIWIADAVDHALVRAAKLEIENYLRLYPKGLYAASARGFLRRCFVLSKDYSALIDEYRWLFEHLDSPLCNLTVLGFAREILRYLPTHQKPVLLRFWLPLAVDDLYRMRRDTAEPLQLAELTAQREAFAGHEQIYSYLLAAYHHFILRNPTATLEAVKLVERPGNDTTTFSGHVLRGLAYEAKDYRLAREYWERWLREPRMQPLQSETLQLALALNYKKDKALALAFRERSLIVDPFLRNAIIHFEAPEMLLREIVRAKYAAPQERRRAAYVLLTELLLKGHYLAFVREHLLLRQLPEQPVQPQDGAVGGCSGGGEGVSPGSDKMSVGGVSGSLGSVVVSWAGAAAVPMAVVVPTDEAPCCSGVTMGAAGSDARAGEDGSIVPCGPVG